MGAYYLVKEVGSDHGHLCCMYYLVKEVYGHLCCMYYLVKEVGSDYGHLCSRTLHYAPFLSPAHNYIIMFIL